ncbi:GNAT family N-acetyltransferase [Labedaea rhizosphaerae]|uniref:Acetyltransferase (GNAT) family protein n=1 Tax=Labedaea rhizosphaerae TaxID=598644 RepID=A0A4R6RXP1_LABRH|nr:GNAT family N-acetyltransferase [Labedaea rhizosphaerae]TDP91849.1 acetyltransferase (GNAT) family protein [Labedaea rhizosphaerae]
MEIRRFDARSATDDELRQLHRITVANQAITRPNEPAPTFDQYVGRLLHPVPGFGKPTRWVAVADDRIVAWTTMFSPEAENPHLTIVEQLVVESSARRRGIGTQLLRTFLPELIAEGRTTIEFWAVTAGGSGESWAHHHGFRATHAVQVQELGTRQVDPARWEVEPPPGYRLVSWRGRCPDDLVESFAVARTAIKDAPLGASEFHFAEWTVARVRAAEAELAEAGIENRVCVAVAHGTVVALTMVELHPHRRDWAYQNDTAVLAEHRGHGLGRCIKAAMTRSLVAELPELRSVRTQTSTSNVHMIATNHALGYTDVRIQIVLTHDVRALARTLGGQRA